MSMICFGIGHAVYTGSDFRDYMNESVREYCNVCRGYLFRKNIELVFGTVPTWTGACVYGAHQDRSKDCEG
jgi:hypothetical protein